MQSETSDQRDMVIFFIRTLLGLVCGRGGGGSHDIPLIRSSRAAVYCFQLVNRRKKIVLRQNE